MKAKQLTDHPIHLGGGGGAVVQPQFTGAMQWYADYAERHAADGAEGRLVTLHTFHEPWEVWEMHPLGSEVVLCTAGSMSLYQEQPDGRVESVTLVPGQYAINEPGIWHTADAEGEATALFITAGAGTQHRPR